MANIANIIGKLTSINTSLGEIKNAIVGGSNTDYDNLTNKPQINSVTLSGNKTSSDLGLVASASVGVASGVAELDNTGHVPSSQLPSYVDDVVEGYYNNVTDKFYSDNAYTTEIPGETGKIYITLDTNLSYRYTGSGFVVVSPSLALGETSSTAYRGDRGKTAYDKSQANETAIGNINTALGNTSISGIGDGSVTGAIYEINANLSAKCLWTNPSPTTDFVAQTISIDLSAYTAIIIQAAGYHNGSPGLSTIAIVGYGGMIMSDIGFNNGAIQLAHRSFNTSSSGVTFYSALLVTNTTELTYNGTCIPLTIYGIK